jgi:hypothetical protein
MAHPWDSFEKNDKSVWEEPENFGEATERYQNLAWAAIRLHGFTHKPGDHLPRLLMDLRVIARARPGGRTGNTGVDEQTL